MRSLRVALAQVNTTVGDLDGNAERIRDYVARAEPLKPDVIAFPEMAITGYPPEDLLLRPSFITDNRRTLKTLAATTAGKPFTLIVGFVDWDTDLYNAAAVIHDGRVVDVYHKQHLPNYGEFYEARRFTPETGIEPPFVEFENAGPVPFGIDLLFAANAPIGGQVLIGIEVCEDLWVPIPPSAAQALADEARYAPADGLIFIASAGDDFQCRVVGLE